MPALAPAKAAANLARYRAAALRARARGHVRRPMPPQAAPDRIEASYVAVIRGLVERSAARAYAPLLRALPSLTDQARQERGDAIDWRLDGTNSGRRASAAVAAAAAEMKRSVTPAAVSTAARKAGRDVDDHNRIELGKQLRAVLGIDLLADPAQRALVEGFVHENVKLIVGLTQALAADVERVLLAGLTGGHLHEMLAKTIQRRLEISAERAELIAVDQIGKINGQVNIARQRAMGLTRFRWRTVGDERVRGRPGGRYPNARPSHYARDLVVYPIDQPPQGRSGEPEWPGIPIRCRCSADPVLDDILAGEGEPQPVVVTGQAGTLPTTEDLEAEAERLRLEVEAMMARTQPVVKPAPPPPPPIVPATPVAPAPVPPAPVAAPPPASPSVEDVRAAVAAVEAEAQRPMATAPPPGVTYSQQAIDGREAFEAGLLTDLGKPVTLDEIAHAYAPPPGLTAHIERAIAGGVDITYKNAAGEVVATMSREFRAGGVVYHASLEVAEKFRGSGIANELNGAALLRYKKMGITSIELDAAWIGRYAWASAGFDIDPDSKARVLAAALRFVDENVPADKREAYRAKVTALIENPSDLARWDDGDRYSVIVNTGDAKERGDYPIGKAILLHHKMPTWSGMMRLDESNPGYRRALQVYGVAARAAKAAPSPAAAAAAPPAPAPTARSPRRRPAPPPDRRPTPAERRAALEARAAARRASGATPQPPSDDPVPPPHDGSDAASRKLVIERVAAGKLEDARAELDAQMRRSGMPYRVTDHGTRSNAVVVTDNLSNARGSWSRSDGTVKILPNIAKDAERFAKQVADGTWDGSTVGLPSQYGALWEKNRPHRDAADGMRVLVHETLHGHGPASGPDYYKGPGVLVEEMATEFAAREWVMNQGGVPAASFDRGGQLGGYRGWGVKMIDAVVEANPSLSRADAAAAVAKASLEYKKLPRGSVTTPDQAVEALAKLLPGDASAWQDRLRAISRTKPHDE